MPPALDTPEEVAAMLAALLGTLTVIGSGIFGALASVFAVWRAKIRPLLTDTRDAAEGAAQQLRTNSGSSVRDSIDRTEQMTCHLLAEVRDLRADQRATRQAADRTHSEIFQRLRILESPPEDTRQ